ncbi:MAG: GNAT family N-acetyltransferase, partial [Coriobacteriaceae bacterium]|nr:GNAT family N-acetyltransferase [Coriobacteriaceae bacterium]
MEDIEDRYELRNIRPEEAAAAAEIEQVCFPPEQACTREEMMARAEQVPELFLVAVERETGTVAGYINGIATDEEHLLDAFYADASLNDPDGDTVMILGVCVLPEHEGQGLARAMMRTYVAREQERGRRRLVL